MEGDKQRHQRHRVGHHVVAVVYGQRLDVEFKAFLRPEQKFNGVEELQRQILADIEAAKDWFTK